ncbi:potassium transporter Kup [Allosphingosinicella indica]|uniref:Probable potassium transport system protein Kup n=1 Tax=Allosphingosinicella indica TaxID=941907 RepID=A0A1X7GVC0_9SPHN|nr:potassium transporter Kup [Allosphingosinicella indica]SMF75289.1 KUP system potassium uptake protein [Allosphingosinicella indica]
MNDVAAAPDAPAGPAGAHDSRQQGIATLSLGALGVVFGDIGTSPLYALRETFVGHHPLAVDPAHILGVLSLIFYSMMLVVTVKYVTIVMRADNKGEGGSLALLALLTRSISPGKRTVGLVLLGVLATSLFYGDSMVTPAISVLSAVEGLTIVNSSLEPLVVPIAIVIIVGLFAIQSRGTARMGAFFGPIMLVYFLILAGLGVVNAVKAPEVLSFLNPYWAFNFFRIDGFLAFLALGSVVLAITGAEALYADMGHFGRKPIALAWLFAALPCLMLNYVGQGALLLTDPSAAQNPFYRMAPEEWRLGLVIIATLATIIASQAMITGAFSVTRQAVQLGFLPRISIRHTSARTQGEIYIPLVNWSLMIACVILVLGFRSSSNLAAAYGIAVTGTMFITTLMLGVLVFRVWNWNPILAGITLATYVIIDVAYFTSNLTKIPDGGWFPLAAGIVIFTFLTTWSKGRRLMIDRMNESAMPIAVFIKSAANSASRVPGTAVFMTTNPDGIPHALLHNLKHNKVLHERVILLTIKVEDVPHVAEAYRHEIKRLDGGFYRLVIHYGFMEEINVPGALASLKDECGTAFKMMDTSFFLARQTLLPSSRPGMAIWREKLFAWMMRNAESAMEFFKLPTNRVVELGSQVEI